MINIFSIKCGLAFAPYLIESAASYLNSGQAVSRVVKQGGSGMILSSDEGLSLRFQNREATLGAREAEHYLSTILFRSEYYDIARLSDEVVVANIGRSLVLSHPQSEMWLDAETVSHLVAAFREQSSAAQAGATVQPRQPLPEWLSISTGAGRLLLSDQRNGRWVLLGLDHLAELERRVALIEAARETARRAAPPAIPVKTLKIRLQSAFKLAAVLEAFAATGEAEPYEEITPAYTLRVGRSVEGVEISDSNLRVAMPAKEARKWAAIIKDELARLNARQIERGNIRTVFADAELGRWVLQWGDEVFVAREMLPELKQSSGEGSRRTSATLAYKRSGDFLLLLEPATGACAALAEQELDAIAETAHDESGLKGDEGN